MLKEQPISIDCTAYEVCIKNWGNEAKASEIRSVVRKNKVLILIQL